MLNSKFLLIAVALASGTLLSAQAGKSIPQTTTYFCYERIPSGQVRDLTDICQKAPAPSPNSGTTPSAKTSTSPTTPASPGKSAPNSEASADRVRIADQARKRKIEFSEYSYDGNMLVGTIKNKTGKPIGGIRVIYDIEVREGEGKWRMVDNDYVLTNNRQLDKNAKTSFSEASARRGDRVTITDVEFD